MPDHALTLAFAGRAAITTIHAKGRALRRVVQRERGLTLHKGSLQTTLVRIFGTGLRGLITSLDRFGRLLARFLSACSPRAYRNALIALGVLVVLMIGGLVYLRATHQRVNAWDSAFLLDGGWRLLNGQRPHTDFYSPFGAVPLLIVALGLAVTRGSAAALSIGYAIIFPFVTLWAWWISRRRLSAVHAFLCAGMVGLLTIGTYRLGSSYRDTTYAMQYNRIGWALLTMLVLQLFLAPLQRREQSKGKADAGRRDRFVSSGLLEGVSAGALLGLILFTKITYFGAGIGLLAVAALLRARRWQPRAGRADPGVLLPGRRVGPMGTSGPLARPGYYGLGLGFTGVVLAMLVYLRFDVVSFFRDMLTLGGAQSLAMRMEALRRVFSPNLVPLLLLGLALILTLTLVARRAASRGSEPRHAPGYRRLQTWSPLIGGIAVALAGLFTCSANTQQGAVPLLGVAALIPLEMVRRSRRDRADDGPPDDPASSLWHPGNWRTWIWVVSSLTTVFLVGSIFLADAGSVAYSAGWKARYASGVPASAHIQSDAMKDLLFPPADGREGQGQERLVASILGRPADDPHFSSQQYAAWVNDGLALLRRHVTDSSRVLSLDWINPFPFALGLPSPRGDALCWAVGLLQSADHHPDAQEVLGDATFVMDPKRSIAPLTYEFKKDYLGPELSKGFERVDQSELWILYERK